MLLEIFQNSQESTCARVSLLIKLQDTFTEEILNRELFLCSEICRDWGLKLNLKKTKILIFNKQGAVVKRHKFYFQGKKMEIVNQYTFLRFPFIPSGKKHVGVEARKAWSSIKKMLKRCKEKTFALILSLWTQ